jgi:hypothetical protein
VTLRAIGLPLKALMANERTRLILWALAGLSAILGILLFFFG